MKIYILAISILIQLLFCQKNVFSQTDRDDFKILFKNSIQNPSSNYYYGKMYKNAESGNALRFLELGYFFNSINEYYLKTGDKSFFQYSQNIINKLKNSSQKLPTGNKWVVNFARKTDTNYEMLNKEYLLYEGYMFRYIAEFVYINYKNNTSYKENLQFVKSNFDKWYERDAKQFGGSAEMFGLRLHMGSHWATVSMYLYKMTSDRKYLNFFNSFNKQVKDNLITIDVNGNPCYIWNSTYKTRFNNLLSQKNRKYNSEKQDVSHGNHVVQFIIDAYKLGMGNWTENDINKLINTLKYIIWKNESIPTDNIDGSSNLKKLINGTGWKQSDGWMKLMQFDKSLYPIYDSYFKNNRKKIETFNPFPQYYINMY